MGILVTSILSLVSSLGGALGSYATKKLEIQQVKLETEKELEIARLKNIGAEEDHTHQRALATLSITARFFKETVYLLFSLPFLACFCGQVGYVDSVFKNLGHLPEGYLTAFLALTCAIFGFPVRGSVTDTIIEGFKASRVAKREHEITLLEKKQAYFEILRDMKGRVSQKDVDDVEKALEDGLGNR